MRRWRGRRRGSRRGRRKLRKWRKEMKKRAAKIYNAGGLQECKRIRI